MSSLTITFKGICVHFHGVVPGVPHRVVLPNASAVRFGILRLPPGDGEPGHEAAFYTMPHLAVIGDPDPQGFNLLLNGSHVQVVNAVGADFAWREGSEFALAQYVPQFAFSEEVVFGGNAACYFDVFHGVGFSQGTGNEPRTTVVEMETDGPPRIRITPFQQSSITVPPQEKTIDSGQLVVSNLDVDAAVEDAPFDFLLNYLVARNGIPTDLTKLTPGMPADPTPLTLQELGGKLQDLGETIARGQLLQSRLQAVSNLILSGGRPTDAVLRTLTHRVVDNQACSDSHYP